MRTWLHPGKLPGHHMKVDLISEINPREFTLYIPGPYRQAPSSLQRQPSHSSFKEQVQPSERGETRRLKSNNPPATTLSDRHCEATLHHSVQGAQRILSAAAGESESSSSGYGDVCEPLVRLWEPLLESEREYSRARQEALRHCPARHATAPAAGLWLSKQLEVCIKQLSFLVRAECKEPRSPGFERHVVCKPTGDQPIHDNRLISIDSIQFFMRKNHHYQHIFHKTRKLVDNPIIPPA